MQIRYRNGLDPKSHEITPESVFLNRRNFLKTATASSLIPILGPFAMAEQANAALTGRKLLNVAKSPYGAGLTLTKSSYATSYNNFYEFGTGKEDPAVLARDFEPKPWTVRIDGEIGKPGNYNLDDLVSPRQLQERIYRFRCVEAWSMVVPWVGIPLADIIKRLEPTSKAKYVAFETLYDPDRMPGQTRRVLDWPYVEGLRMDEAMNPLTLMAVGMYGEELPNQNGAPLRLVVPWKYGFKSIKTIVRISLVEKMPPTTWNRTGPGEYGFFANVNPDVPHPRWSQAKERVLGAGYFSPKVATLKFNGYGEEVASLYAGMDLAKFY